MTDLIERANKIADKGVQKNDGYAYSVPASDLVEYAEVIRALIAELGNVEKATLDAAADRIALIRYHHRSSDFGSGWWDSMVSDALVALRQTGPVHDSGCEADWGSQGQESPCCCGDRSVEARATAAREEAHRRYDGDTVVSEVTGERESHDDWGYAECQRAAFIAGTEWRPGSPEVATS